MTSLRCAQSKWQYPITVFFRVEHRGNVESIAAYAEFAASCN